jgi:hypothetical protein
VLAISTITPDLIAFARRNLRSCRRKFYSNSSLATQSHAASDYGYDNREDQDDEECNDDAVDDE